MRRDTRWSTLISFAIMLLMRPGVARAQEPARPVPDLASGETYRIEFFGGYWTSRANVVVSSDAPGLPGTRIDFKRDLGLTDRAFPELQVTWRPALRHKLRAQYIPVHFDSAATLPRDLVFNGVTYAAGASTTESLDWTTYRFGYEYGIIVKRRGSLGVVAEVKHTVVRAALRSALAQEVSRQAMPVPAVGAVARVYPAPRLSVTGEVTFFGVPDSADRHFGGHIADVDVSATWNFSRNVGAQAGFRDIDINHLGEWNTATFSLKGAYFGAVLRY
jgi:hypothetical protein